MQTCRDSLYNLINMKRIEKTEYAAVTERLMALDKDYAAKEEIMLQYSERRGVCRELFDVSPIGGFKVLQGGTTDGKYIYLALVSLIVNGYQNGIIVKLDRDTGELIKASECMEIDHANDITYDPHKNRLVVVHNVPNNDTLTFVDPDTLEYLGSEKIPLRIFSIHYQPERRKYAVGISRGQDFAILNEDFEVEERFSALNTTYITQGMFGDAEHIYFVQFKNSCIMKYDWQGNFEEYIPIDKRRDEPENLFFIDGELYVGFNQFRDGHLAPPGVARVEFK